MMLQALFGMQSLYHLRRLPDDKFLIDENVPLTLGAKALKIHPSSLRPTDEMTSCQHRDKGCDGGRGQLIWGH